MNIIVNVVNTILDAGYIVMLPIMITLIGVIFKMNFGKALKAGLMIGIGLQGINLVAGYMVETLTPVIDYYSAMGGSGFPILDYGYEFEFLLDFSVPWAAIAIVLCIAINVLLIKFTPIKVMNVDVWNFANFFTVGVIVYYTTGSLVASLIVTLVMSVIVLIYAQHIAKDWQEFTGFEGVTCTTYSMSMVYFIGVIVNKIFDAIPGLRNVDINIDNLREKAGVLVDTPVLGAIVGLFMGIISKQPAMDCLVIACKMSACLVLLPKIAGLLMEGLNPLSTAIRKYMQSKNETGKELIIGMDIATGIGEPCGVAVAVLMIPLIVIVALICPWIKSFPALLLGGTIYWSVMASMVHKKNVFRALITSVLFLTLALTFTTMFADVCGTIIVNAGLADSAVNISSIGLCDRVASVIALIVGRMFI